MPILAIANQKGGVGKTTTTLNLGMELARRDFRVLLVDMDPQASLTATLGIDAAESNLADVLGIVERGDRPLERILLPVEENLDLAPGDILLSRTELGLVVRPAREQQLARALSAVVDRYAMILIDCPPSLGLLTVNALIAADAVIVPTLLDALALRGLGLFVETLDEVRQDYGRSAALLGVLGTMADLRTIHARDVLAALKAREDLRLFEAVVPRSIRFSEAALTRQSIARYDPSHVGAVAYSALAEEVLTRVT